MARIVLGMALSHSPQLHTPADQWAMRLEADYRNPALHFRGRSYRYAELLALREGERIDRFLGLEEKAQRLRRANAAVEHMARIYREVQPDVAVIVGNDQHELFVEDVMPAMTIYWGEEVRNVPAREDQARRMPAGIHLAEAGHAPPQPLVHPGQPSLGRHLIEHAIRAGFDVAQSQWMREADQRISFSTGAPHAFGFVYRNVMGDEVIPHVPVILNTFYPPNQPTAARCWTFGQALGRAVREWPHDLRVAVFGSGGLSHFVIDEDFDRRFIQAVAAGDGAALGALEESWLQSGTSECKNWITAAGMLEGAGLRAEVVEQVACYRSPAGTGTGTGFVCWR
ncbi:MAG TPA: protocatechuate 3,4-dioxygenase [Ramlibacter sp.]|nr:protocatechuate 3,4-dioxygenase [Ramlibacter sp.]